MTQPLLGSSNKSITSGCAVLTQKPARPIFHFLVLEYIHSRMANKLTMSRSARITLLLVIDVVFFFVELIVGS